MKTDLVDQSLYLFLDYDGTLSPIVSDPSRAILSLRMKRRLERLVRAVRDRGVTVFVGAPRQTKARYYLRNVGEVAEFLGRLARI